MIPRNVSIVKSRSLKPQSSYGLTVQIITISAQNAPAPLNTLHDSRISTPIAENTTGHIGCPEIEEMPRYSWEDVQDEVADLARIAEDIEKRTSLDRLARHAPTDAPTLDFSREGIEQLQEDVITFLEQFDEMTQQLVDDIC